MKRFIFGLIILLWLAANTNAAELLIKAIDNPDPQGYKIGHVVVVMDDGHVWGNGEQLPAFIVMKVPGVRKEEFAKYTESYVDLTDPDKPIILERRLWKIQLNKLPIPVKGVLTVKSTEILKTWEAVKPFIVNVSTGLVEKTAVVK